MSETSKTPEPKATNDEVARARATTALGWIAGGSLGLLLEIIAFWLSDDPESFPVIPVTFVAFLVGAFGGMAVSDRLGSRGFRPLGIAAGVLLSILLTLLMTVWLSPTP